MASSSSLAKSNTEHPGAFSISSPSSSKQKCIGDCAAPIFIFFSVMTRCLRLFSTKCVIMYRLNMSYMAAAARTCSAADPAVLRSACHAS